MPIWNQTQRKTKNHQAEGPRYTSKHQLHRGNIPNKSKKNQKSEFTMEVGGWVQVSLGILFSFGKSSKNCPRPVLIFWSSIICVVVNYYDFSVLSTSVMSFQKEKFGRWWVGWVSSIQFYFGFLEFLKLCKAPLPCGRGNICSSGRRGTPSVRAQGSLAATPTTCPGTEPSSSGRGCWH